MARKKLDLGDVFDPREWPPRSIREHAAKNHLSDAETAALAWIVSQEEPGQREALEDGAKRFRRAADTAAAFSFELRAKAQWVDKQLGNWAESELGPYAREPKGLEQLSRDVEVCLRWKYPSQRWDWRKLVRLFRLSSKAFWIPKGRSATDPDKILQLALNFRTAADMWITFAGLRAKKRRGRPADTELPRLVAFARERAIPLRELARVFADNRVLFSGRMAGEMDDEHFAAWRVEQEVAWLERLRDCEKRQRRRGNNPKA
jgi:hypothetical protein